MLHTMAAGRTCAKSGVCKAMQSKYPQPSLLCRDYPRTGDSAGPGGRGGSAEIGIFIQHEPRIAHAPKQRHGPVAAHDFPGHRKKPRKGKEYLRVIERNGRILLSLINDILDLSKIEAGRMDIYHTDFDPSRLVAQALETIAPMAEKKGIAVHVEAPEVLSMRCDEDKVNQILLNSFPMP